MPATSPAGICLDTIKTVLEDVPAIAGSVYQSKVVFSELEDFEGAIRVMAAEVEGAMAFWPSKRVAGQASDPGQLDVTGMLFYNLPSTDSEMDDSVDMAETILGALMNQDNFADVGIRPVVGSWVPSLTDYENGVGIFDFALTYRIPQVCDASGV